MVAEFGLLKYELHHMLSEPSKVKPFVIEKLFCGSFDFYLSCLVTVGLVIYTVRCFLYVGALWCLLNGK